MKTSAVLPFVLWGIVACAATGRAADGTGMASWYGSECRQTASGERYDPSSLTAAHRTLPFGTRVMVKNITTSRSVAVRINNRGPFRKGRVIDVSKAAAEQLGMMTSGIAQVEITVLK